jgi:hypothetical protein
MEKCGGYPLQAQMAQHLHHYPGAPSNVKREWYANHRDQHVSKPGHRPSDDCHATCEKIAKDSIQTRPQEQTERVICKECECAGTRLNVFSSILKQEPSAKQRLKKMRDTLADLLTDRDWIVLHAEFEAGALRNERLRQSFLELNRQQIRDGVLVKELLRSSDVTSSLRPADFTMVMVNLAHGLAVTQRILGTEFPQKSARKLIQSLFDHLIRPRD